MIRSDLLKIGTGCVKAGPDRIARLKRELATATRRENRRLAEVLTYKADVYGPAGRIYSFEHKWTVAKDGRLLLDGSEIDPLDLRDGNGRVITDESSL